MTAVRAWGALGFWCRRHRALAGALGLGACLAAGWATASRGPGPAPAESSPPGFTSAADVARSLATQEAWRAMELRFPGATQQAAEAAWAAHPRGADDPALRADVRKSMRQLVVTALATAPDALLEQHAQLMRLKLAAAATQDAGPLLCQGVLDGSLDLTGLLPPKVLKADEALQVLLAATPPRRGRLLSRGAAHRAMAPVLLALTPAQVQALAAVRRPGRMRCEAFTGFYDAIARLAPADRRLALRAALQVER